MAWHGHISVTHFIIQQSRSFEGVCVPLCLTNCLLPIPNSQPMATKHFQSPLDLEQSSAAYHICSVTFCLLLSLEDILFELCYPKLALLCPRIGTVIYGHCDCSYSLTYWKPAAMQHRCTYLTLMPWETALLTACLVTETVGRVLFWLPVFVTSDVAKDKYIRPQPSRPRPGPSRASVPRPMPSTIQPVQYVWQPDRTGYELKLIAFP